MFEAKYKALSVRQPWAWLICAGYKDIENRDWAIPKSQLPQRVYIHAGKHLDETGWDFIQKRVSQKVWTALWNTEFIRNLPRGAIIGEVAIMDCVDKSNSKWFVGRYGFVLAYPVLYERPIPCKGKLGLFEPELTEVSVYKLEVT